MTPVLYSNPGPHTVYIGGRAIPPGEAREVDAALIPPERPNPPGDEVPFAGDDAGTPVAGEGLSAPVATASPAQAARKAK